MIVPKGVLAISFCTVKQYKAIKTKSNEEKIVNREFNRNKPMEAIVSDISYVNIKDSWHYICLIIDLFKIIGYSAGKEKDAKLIQ